jgi:hypothetical protein
MNEDRGEICAEFSSNNISRGRVSNRYMLNTIHMAEILGVGNLLDKVVFKRRVDIFFSLHQPEN